MTLQEDLKLIAFRDQTLAALTPDSTAELRSKIVKEAYALEDEKKRNEDAYVQANYELSQKRSGKREYWDDLKKATAESAVFRVEEQYVVPERENRRPPPPAAAPFIYDY